MSGFHVHDDVRIRETGVEGVVTVVIGKHIVGVAPAAGELGVEYHPGDLELIRKSR